MSPSPESDSDIGAATTYEEPRQPRPPIVEPGAGFVPERSATLASGEPTFGVGGDSIDPSNGDGSTGDEAPRAASPVPEPGSLLLFGSGLSLLAMSRRRRRAVGS